MDNSTVLLQGNSQYFINLFQTVSRGFCDFVYFKDEVLETGLYTGIEQIDSKSLGKCFNFFGPSSSARKQENYELGCLPVYVY